MSSFKSLCSTHPSSLADVDFTAVNHTILFTMPVLFKGAGNDMYPAVDVETLVSEVRDRLCLKNRDKFSSSRRSAPYHINKHSAVFEHCHRKHTTPESCVYHGHCKKRSPSSCSSCTCNRRLSSKLRDSNSIDDPRVLLEKLLSEQSLIQEAVRRLQSQRSSSPTVSTCGAGKFFPFVDDDSCDQFSNQTPLYSESEDDSVSQHSVDL